MSLCVANYIERNVQPTSLRVPFSLSVHAPVLKTNSHSGAAELQTTQRGSVAYFNTSTFCTTRILVTLVT